MVNKTQVQICASVFFLVLSIAFVIVGVLLPGQIVQPLINSGVKSAVPINADNFKPAYDYTVGSDWNKWVNTSLNSNYHVYNLTNLYDVLTTGALPIYEDIQVNVINWKWKFNITYNADQTLVSYYEANFYVIQDQFSQDLLTKTIISPNVLFTAAAQQAQYSIDYLQAAQTAAAGGAATFPTSYQPYTDDIVMSLYILNVVQNIYNQFTSDASTLLQTFHLLAVYPYFQTISQLTGGLSAAGLTLPGSTNSTTFVDHWAKLDGNTAWSTTLASAGQSTYAFLFSGFELPAAITNVNLLNVIWNAAQRGSLARGDIYGILLWAQGLPGGKYYGSLSLEGELFGILSSATFLGSALNLADFQTILTWIGSLLTPHAQGGFFENFEAAVVAGIRQELFLVPYLSNTHPDIQNLQTFKDLALYQFATGGITSLLQSTIPQKILNYPTGTINVLGAEGGLGTATNVNNPEPLEIATACYIVNTPYYNTSGGPAVFSLADVNAIFSGFNTTTAEQEVFAITLVVALQKALPIWQDNSAFLQSHYPGIAWTTYINSISGQFPPEFASAIILTLESFTFMNNATTAQCFFDWFYAYLGNEMTGVVPNDKYAPHSPYVIGADGVAPQNSGMFFRITIGEVLTGVPATATRLGQKIPGAMCDDFELISFGTNQFSPSVMQTVIDATYLRDIGRQTILYTGADDYRKTGLLYQTYGTRQFQGSCQISDPAHTGSCAGVTSGIPNTIFQNYTVWNTPTNLDLVSNALEFPALQGDQQSLFAWVSNIARAVPFALQGGLQVKDISTNQYYVDQSVIFSNFTSPNAWKSSVWNDALCPDGTLDLTSFENAPIIVSWPHFYQADPHILNTMRGITPSYLLHHSEIDMDPLTGLTIQAFKRLQANFKWTPNSLQWNHHYDNFFKNTTYVAPGDTVPYAYVPYYWGDQNNVISDSDNNKYYNAILLPKKIANILQIVLPIVGGIGMIIFTITLYRSCTPRETTKTKYGDV